jgi:Protein of unknown function (DUF2490)
MKVNHKYIKLKYLFILLAITFVKSLGQSNKDDFQARIGTSLKLSLNHGWDISTQYQFRITDNITHYKGSYFSGEIEKSLGEHFSVMTEYRLALVDKGTYHRYAFAIEASHKIGIVTIALRPRIQHQKQNFNGDDEGSSDTDTYLRTRLTVKSPITKQLDAYVYAEPFYKLDKNPNLDWWRNSVGLKYEYAKRKKINLFYIWQPDYSKKLFRTINIIGLGLDFTIKPNK